MWIITKDLTADWREIPPCNANASGMKSADYDGRVQDLAFAFRMLDDDREDYYYGLSTKENFDPLDNFGTPNAGCTQIEYWKDHGWKGL